jgi:transposase
LRVVGGGELRCRPYAYTLIATAEMNGWDPEAYLRELLTRVADHPINRIGEITPWMMTQDKA